MHQGDFCAALIGGNFGGENGAASGNLAAPADALLSFGRLLVEAVLVELPRPIGLAGTRRAILTKFNPELLFFAIQFTAVRR